MKKYLFIVVIIIFSSLKTFGQWHLTNGPTGGFTNCIITDGNKIFTGGYGFIFSSSDSGNTWNALGMNLGNGEINCVAFNGNDVYAGGEGRIYYSPDNGQSWVSNYYGYAKAVTANATSVYFGGLDGLYKSTDHGITFTVPDSNLFMKNISALASDMNNIYVGTNSGIYISNDNGLSWNFSDSILADLRIYSIYVHDTDLFSITSNNIFISHDNGASWDSSNTGLNGYASFLSFIGTTIFALADTQIYSSTNNGSTWQLISSTVPDIARTCMNSIGNILLIGGYDGINISRDSGVTWHSSNTDLVNDGGLHFTGNGNNLYVQTLTSRLAVSHDDGNSWIDFDFSGNNVNSVAANSSFVIAGTNTAGVFVSYDDGYTWTQQNTGLTDLQILSLTIDGSNAYLATSDGLYVSTDHALTWSLRNSICCADGMAAENNKMLINLSGDLYYSQDTGYNWTAIPSISGGEPSGGRAINNGRLFEGIDFDSRYSDDGINWTISSYMPNDIYSFYFSGDNAFAVAPGYGIGYSPDNGITWSRIDSTLYDNGVSCVYIDQNNIFADAEFTGVWTRPLNEIINNIKTISQNEITIVPNPSTSIFNISILNNKGKLKANLYNSIGTCIMKTTIDSDYSKIDLSSFPSGIYFIQIFNDEKSYTAKNSSEIDLHFVET